MEPKRGNRAISVLTESLNFTSPLEDIISTPMEGSQLHEKLAKNTMVSPRFDKRLELRTIPVSNKGGHKHRKSLPGCFQRHFEAYQDYKAK